MSAVYVYILQCADGTLYTGWTTDLARRLATHNAGRGSHYTCLRRPVHLVYWEDLPDRASAQRRELEVKRLPRARKLALVDGFDSGRDCGDAQRQAHSLPAIVPCLRKGEDNLNPPVALTCGQRPAGRRSRKRCQSRPRRGANKKAKRKIVVAVRTTAAPEATSK